MSALIDPQSPHRLSPQATIRWYSATVEERAAAVIEWCEQHGIAVGSIMPYQLAAAMELTPADTPEGFLRMMRALLAFLRSRL